MTQGSGGYMTQVSGGYMTQGSGGYIFDAIIVPLLIFVGLLGIGKSGDRQKWKSFRDCLESLPAGIPQLIRLLN